MSQALLDSRYSRLRGMLPAAGEVPALAAAASIAREVASLLGSGTLPQRLRPLRIACLRNVTIEPLIPQVVAALAERDFAVAVELGGLGNYLFEIASSDSFLYSKAFDVCVVLVSAESVLPGLDDPAASFDDVDGAMQGFLECLDLVADRFAGLSIVCNFGPIGPRAGRRLQSQHAASARYAIGRANQLIAARVQQHPRMVVCDLDYLAQQVGATQFYSARNMATVLQPFSIAGFHHICREWADLCLLHFRGSAKCVVLDCDNTLWHGIVGEDGIHGIRLGEGYPGVCFQQFQRQLKHLRSMGLLLAINSKNNEADVRAIFDEHPGAVLKYDDFAAIRVNWESKSENMASIAEELNLGMESFVFIDDNLFEIEQVKSACPDVACVQVPGEVWKLPELLGNLVRLDRLAITREDRQKAEMYQQERMRKTIRAGVSNIDDYLAELQLEMTIERFVPGKHLERAAQLIHKTNQFNLTARRYSSSDILALAESGAMIYLASLRDRFGDYGRIALAIVAFDDAVPRLDTFLLSCRAIGRRAETMFLTFVTERLRAEGHGRIRGEFIPSSRNRVCENFLHDNGFTSIARPIEGDACFFERDLALESSDVAKFYRVNVVEP